MGSACSGIRIPRKVLLTGWKGSGKTTLLYFWCGYKCTDTESTESFNVEMLLGPGGCQLVVWDVTDPVRRRQFYHGTEALVYVIDSSDRDCVKNVQQDLDVLLHDRDLQHIPLLLVLSKCDLSESRGLVRSDLEEQLHLTDRCYSWSTVRWDDKETYSAALYKLTQLFTTP